MEELLTKLLSTLQVPSIVIAISAIVFRVITFLPVTFVTAQEIERKIYTKEQRLLHQILHYLFKMIVVTIIMVPIGDLFANNPEWYVNGIALFAVVYLNVFFAIIFWMANESKKITDLVRIRNRVFLLFGTLIYLLTIFALPPYFAGSIVGAMYRTKEGTVVLEQLLVLILLFFICSAFIVAIIKPLNRVLAFKTEKVVSIELEKEGKNEKWYLLHPVKSDSYLIGDNYIPGLCKRNRIITKEELVQKEFLIEALDDLKSEPSKAEEKTVTS